MTLQHILFGFLLCLNWAFCLTATRLQSQTQFLYLLLISFLFRLCSRKQPVLFVASCLFLFHAGFALLASFATFCARLSSLQDFTLENQFTFSVSTLPSKTNYSFTKIGNIPQVFSFHCRSKTNKTCNRHWFLLLFRHSLVETPRVFQTLFAFWSWAIPSKYSSGYLRLRPFLFQQICCLSRIFLLSFRLFPNSKSSRTHGIPH